MDGNGANGSIPIADCADIYNRCVAPLQSGAIKSQTNPYINANVEGLSLVFDNNGTQQLAFHTIVGEVMRHRLAWMSGTNVLDDVPVPQWWHTFVRDAIRAIMITGSFAYKTWTEKGLAMGRVANVNDVWPMYNKQKQRWVSSDKKYTLVMVETPLLTREGVRLRSGSVRAAQLTERLDMMEEAWTRRDNANSRPSVYTSVSDRIQGQNGSDRQWFRNVSHPDVLQTRAVDIDSNFASLVSKRAETIAKLDSLTHVARARQQKSEYSATGAAPSAGGEKTHTEMIVSDGRTFTEMRPLHSLPDGRAVYDSLVHNILWSFSVPPQALGKNVNSERQASSNRLTEMAVTSYMSVVRAMRQLIGEVLKDATETKEKTCVGFSVVLSQHELNDLLPVLKTEIAINMIAKTFDLPANYLEKDAVKQRQQESEGQGSGGNKRPRTAEEDIAAVKRRAGTEKK